MSLRINEISILIYRIFLAYINYTFCRLLFIYFNNDLLQIDNFLQLTKLLYHGIRFDSMSIVYLNSIFILLSIIPFKINTSKIYQDVLIWIYFIFNGIGMLLNFIDFEYYRFNLNRLMSSFLEAIESEPNKSEISDCSDKFIRTRLWPVARANILIRLVLPTPGLPSSSTAFSN